MPLIDVKELRPRTRWYWIGGLTIPIGGLAAFLVFLGLLLSSAAKPEFIAEFQGGDSATFQVEEGQDGHWGLYVTGGASRSDCALDTPSGSGRGPEYLKEQPHPYSGTAYDDWWLAAEIATPEPGEYVLSCGISPESYAIGTLEQTASSYPKLLAGLLVLVVLGPLSFIAGVVILIVTGYRRSSHHTRLIRERMQASFPPHGPTPNSSAPNNRAPGGPQH